MPLCIHFLLDTRRPGRREGECLAVKQFPPAKAHSVYDIDIGCLSLLISNTISTFSGCAKVPEMHIRPIGEGAIIPGLTCT